MKIVTPVIVLPTVTTPAKRSQEVTAMLIATRVTMTNKVESGY